MMVLAGDVSDNEKRALADLCSFLVWLEEDQPGAMWGSVKVLRAIQAFSEITGLTMDQIVQVAHAGEKR